MLTVTLILTFIVALQTMGFIQAVLHKVFGHNPIKGLMFLHAVHNQSHHKAYTADQFESAVYDQDEESITFSFLIPVAVISGIAYGVLPVEYFIAIASGSAVSYLLQIYLHTHFHLSKSWLLSYLWFRRLKRLHRVHHVYPDKNYGLINFYFDKLSGTYLENESR